MQHQQRGAVPRPALAGRGRDHGSRCAAPAPPGAAVVAGPVERAARSAAGSRGSDLDAEALGLDGQRLLHLELVVRVVDQPEALQDHAEREHRLLQRELAPDAGALPVAERLEGVGRQRAFGLAA